MKALVFFAARWFASALLACAAAGPSWAQQSPGDALAAPEQERETRTLHLLFERHATWLLQTFPEIGTYRGDHRNGHRPSDASADALARRDHETAEFLAAARSIRRQRLGATDRISLDLFVYSQQRAVDMARHPAARGMTLRALGGLHTQLADLVQLMPVDRPERVRQLLARLGAIPRRIDEEMASLRASAAAGWVPARDVLQRSLAQLDAQIAGEIEASPFFQPFMRLGREIGPAERETFAALGREAIATQVLPGLKRLRAFVAEELLPAAPAEGSLARYPEGAAVYAMAVRHNTTTELTPQQIHEIGQRELARLRGEMEAVMREVKWSGSFAGFSEHLHTDERYLAKGPEALVAGYREIAKRIDAELPRLFAELPRAPYGIRAMPVHMGANRAEYYQGPALDGSRAGTFFANALAWRRRPLWSMETLVAHETVPGHHLQIARAAELRDLPEFRRSGFGFTAFSEGWALYAETLGFELGLYADPLSRYGHLMWQAFRAARLVVDTGMHALGWSRQQCVDFMVERTGVGREFVESEIDRYASLPGQALAYMVGKLKFAELRERARMRLGERFDLRRFHNAVLDQGALPLTTLEAVIDEWIAAQAAREVRPGVPLSPAPVRPVP